MNLEGSDPDLARCLKKRLVEMTIEPEFLIAFESCSLRGGPIAVDSFPHLRQGKAQLFHVVADRRLQFFGLVKLTG